MTARSRFAFVGAMAIVAALAIVPAASATPPERFHNDVSEADPHFLQCDGFEIGISTTGTEDVTLFFDEAGEVVKVVVRLNVADVLTNSVTGKTVVNRGVFQETFSRIDGTDEFTSTLTGFRFMGTSPGEGVVLQDVGRIVFSPGEEEVLFLAGPHHLLRKRTSRRCSAPRSHRRHAESAGCHAEPRLGRLRLGWRAGTRKSISSCVTRSCSSWWTQCLQTRDAKMDLARILGDLTDR